MKKVIVLACFTLASCVSKNPYQVITEYGPEEGLYRYQVDKDVTCVIVSNSEGSLAMDCINNRQYNLKHEIQIEKITK